MNNVYGCSECRPPEEIGGVFAFLYLAGTAPDIQYLDLKGEDRPINRLICSRHCIGGIERLFLDEGGLMACSGLMYGLLKARGYNSNEGLVIEELWTPGGLLSVESARICFPNAIEMIDEELRMRKPAHVTAD